VPPFASQSRVQSERLTQFATFEQASPNEQQFVSRHVSQAPGCPKTVPHDPAASPVLPPVLVLPELPPVLELPEDPPALGAPSDPGSDPPVLVAPSCFALKGTVVVPESQPRWIKEQRTAAAAKSMRVINPSFTGSSRGSVNAATREAEVRRWTTRQAAYTTRLLSLST